MILQFVTLEFRDSSGAGTICIAVREIVLLIYGVTQKGKVPFLFFLFSFLYGFFSGFLCFRFCRLFFFFLRGFRIFLFFEGGF